MIDQTKQFESQGSTVSIARRMKTHRNYIKTGKNQTLQIERQLLAMLLDSSKEFSKVSTTINENSFFSERHRYIFRAISEVATQNTPYDSMKVVEWFTIHNLLDVVDLVGYINQIMQSRQDSSDSSDSVLTLAEKVRDFSLLRGLVSISSEILSITYNPQGRDARQMLILTQHMFSTFFDQPNIRDRRIDTKTNPKQP